MFIRYQAFGWLSMMSLVLAVGCSGSDAPEHPDTVSAAGTVLYKGQPLEGADVSLTSPDKPAASGHTDAQGRFVLSTYFGPKDRADGVVPGEYSVTIRKMENPDGMSAEEMQQAFTDPTKGPLASSPENVLPEKYADAKTSGLTAAIGSDGAKDLEFKLQD